jgi:hypothetical protein
MSSYVSIMAPDVTTAGSDKRARLSMLAGSWPRGHDSRTTVGVA